MDLKEFKSIVEIMNRADLTELEIEEEGFKLRIRRHAGERLAAPFAGGSNPPFPVALPVAETVTSPSSPAAAAAPVAAKEENGVAFIKSPMVGTFYRAASPEGPPFAEVGDTVADNTVVCIIEAMKVMNEIQAEARGKILEILVENGKAVEYGQPLFKIKSATV